MIRGRRGISLSQSCIGSGGALRSCLYEEEPRRLLSVRGFGPYCTRNFQSNLLEYSQNITRK